MTFIRENSEGEYAGSGSWLFKGKPNEVVIQDGVFSRVGCERIIRYAFETAKKRGAASQASARPTPSITRWYSGIRFSMR